MDGGIAGLRRHLDCRINEIAERLSAIERTVKHMATRAELDVLKAELMTAIKDATTRVTVDIQALRDALATGTPVTDQDLSDLQTDIGAVGAIDPAPAVLPAPAVFPKTP